MKHRKPRLFSDLRIVSLLVILMFLTSCSINYPEVRPSGDVGGVDICSEPLGVPGLIRQDLYHVVAPGETLWRISQMYEVDIETIKRANRIRDVRELEIGQKLYVPDAASRKEIITLYPSRKWKYIIVHHSATDEGNSEFFNKAHLRRGWAGVGYHFVIDNGTCGKDDGQIETTPRWIKQRNGAHCKANDMNEKAIGICLVGNFSEDKVSPRQMRSLVYLTKQLQDYYHIPRQRILGHGQVKGARTECPGKKFPWKTFYAHLKR